MVTHEEQFPSATISFDTAPGYSLGDAVDAVHQAEAAIGMPATISGSFAGDAAEFQRSLAAEPWLILASLVVIYIVLGVLYESWIHPVTILSTLPSAGHRRAARADAVRHRSLAGGAGRRGAADGHREEERDHDDRLRDRGRAGARPAAAAAIEEACLLRFRPIMMTTMAALLGAVPLVLSAAPGRSCAGRWG